MTFVAYSVLDCNHLGCAKETRTRSAACQWHKVMPFQELMGSFLRFLNGRDMYFFA